MSKVALTHRRRFVLRVAEFCYVDGVEKVATVSGLKPHAVRYDLRELMEMKVLTPCLFFNETCFGYYIFHVHLSTHVSNVELWHGPSKKTRRWLTWSDSEAKGPWEPPSSVEIQKIFFRL